MTSKVLYSNSNEICPLIESTCGWSVSPLESSDDPRGPGELLLFDLQFYKKPDHHWSVQELLQQQPEWERQILPLLKVKQYALLFTIDWYLMSYAKELDIILFQPAIAPPKTLKDKHCLLSTMSLTFMMRQKIKNLIKPVTYAREMSQRLSVKLKRLVDFDLPADFKEVCDKLEDLVCSLDKEGNHWKDRFFFDALDANVDDLCEDCKESMRVAFYVTDDRSQALKWKQHSGDCCWHNCKYYKMDLFDDFNMASDLREVPCNDYQGSDSE